MPSSATLPIDAAAAAYCLQDGCGRTWDGERSEERAREHLADTGHIVALRQVALEVIAASEERLERFFRQPKN